MPYSSSLTDKEWKIIEPLLPQKKQTRPPKWTKRQILDGIFDQLKNGCNWCDLPKDLPPYSTVFWHYKQWRGEGVIEQIISNLAPGNMDVKTTTTCKVGKVFNIE